MDDQRLSRRGTQIGDLPSSFIIDILSRLAPKPLLTSKLVCRSWFRLFSDPLFLKIQLTQAPTLIIRRPPGTTNSLMCTNATENGPGEKLCFDVTLPRTPLTCANSCRGLLCLESVGGRNVTFVCNPILGEYITIPNPNISRPMVIKSVLGFSSRSNKFKLLRIHRNENEPPAYKAQIYTIGDGTRQWRSIGIAPSCINDFPEDSVDSFLNGSIHWADAENHKVVYFDFESEEFGSLPSPPAWRDDGRWSKFSHVRVVVSHGCLCIYAFPSPPQNSQEPSTMEKWVMTEYGVEESWRVLFYNLNFWNCEPIEYFYIRDHVFNRIRSRASSKNGGTTSYSPSIVSLQDVAKSEDFTVSPKTRTCMDDMAFHEDFWSLTSSEQH